jgi:hypothetical protein
VYDIEDVVDRHRKATLYASVGTAGAYKGMVPRVTPDCYSLGKAVTLAALVYPLGQIP